MKIKLLKLSLIALSFVPNIFGVTISITSPANNSVINQVRPTISGTATPNMPIDVYFDSFVFVSTVHSDGSGNWSAIADFDLSLGGHSVIAQVVNGNVVLATTTNTFSIANITDCITLIDTLTQAIRNKYQNPI